MPKYYCDVCDCSFPNNLTNRKNHDKGLVHINNKRRHYDWFKDPDDFINEQLNKPPCRRYRQNGYCEYELDCKYSHLIRDYKTGQLLFPKELLEWLDAKAADEQQQKQQQQQQQQTKKSSRKSIVYRLPPGWKVKELPPSLKPPTLGEDYDWNHVGIWG
ncbi:uncharacterized protein BX664DRAFT_332635 [Halteromyces radiatus]|uniref:uncharacterized protein n=1 Tax=Halteromyces radiatus TaxID=101107 RepID=UPI00221F1975|nr:uncharacterized protein BX664DRAFT_332635 [Halteromyces radiatus]KAI8089287.1 hypothetical protein BX664DRAFT_332635 [Halteromyces radiatus]